MNKPSDQKIREAIEEIFQLNREGDFGLGRSDTGIKSRQLLRHWPLSRVERVEFRSAELPKVILKQVVEPMQLEISVYQDLFNTSDANERRQTPRLYGHHWYENELWMFLEDVGTHTLKSDPTIENLQQAVIALAGIHVLYERDAASGSLQSRTRIPVHDYDYHVNTARQTLVLVRALCNKNLFPQVTNRDLSKLESIVDMYQKVALGLAAAPQTLVHGDYAADNIMFDEESGRVIILDWGDAHVGPGLLDLIELNGFATAEFGPKILPRLLQAYRSAYRSASGEPLAAARLEELLVCSQIEKKMSLMHWFAQCSLKWIPSGVEAYNFMVAGLIEETYELSTILV
jgi:serine/threonine protein kinase